MTPVSDEAFAIMATCPKHKKNYGITVDYIGRNAYKFVWAFKIDREKAKREGYDTRQVHGSVELDSEYPGCPYCKSKRNVFCSCGTVVCWNGESVITCPSCGQRGEISAAESVSMKGGGF